MSRGSVLGGRVVSYLWVQGALFVGQRSIDFLLVSAPFFRAQRRGDNGKLIQPRFWINIQASQY